MSQEERIQRNKDAFQKAALYWNNLANQRLSDFNKHLLGLATLLLPLTASIVGVESIKLGEFEKTILALGWVFLGISIIAGSIHTIIESIYFNYLSNDSSRREEIWSSDKKIEEMEENTKALGKTSPASNPIPLAIQIFSILIGIILIMIVAGSLLFKR